MSDSWEDENSTISQMSETIFMSQIWVVSMQICMQFLVCQSKYIVQERIMR